MADNYFDISVGHNAGINTYHPDQSYIGDAASNYELWAGYEGGGIVHRFLFNSNVPGNSHGGSPNWIDLKFNFKVNEIASGAKIHTILENSYPWDWNNFTWNSHAEVWVSNSLRNVEWDSPWYFLRLDPDVWAYLDGGLGYRVMLREPDWSTPSFMKIRSIYDPDSSDRPWIRVYYMRNPVFDPLYAYNGVNGQVYVTWPKTIEGDDYWVGYNIQDGSGNNLYTGVGVDDFLHGRGAVIEGLPNGTTVSLRIRGRYHSDNAGYKTSSDYSTLSIPVADKPVNFTVTDDDINKATLSWTKPPKNGGEDPKYYKIYHSTNGTSFSLLATTTSLSYNHTPIYGRHYYYVTALYGKVNPWADVESIATDTKQAFINQRPTAGQTFPMPDQVVDPQNCSFVITFSDPDSGDTLQSAEVQVQTLDGVTYSKTKSGVSTTITFVAADGMLSGTQLQWRTRVQDDHGLWSYWTSWRNFKSNTKPTMSNYSPADGGYTDDDTPTLSVRFNDPDVCSLNGADYCQYIQLQVWNMTKTSMIWDSGSTQAPIEGGTGQVKNGQTASILVGTTLDKQKTYSLKVRVQDNHGTFSNTWSAWQWLELNVYYETNAVTYTVMEPDITGLSTLKAHVGELVTVTGNYFGTIQRNSELEIQSVEAIIDSWSDTSIVFYVPSLPVTGIYQPVRIENNVSGFDDEYTGLYIYDNDPILNELIPISIGTNALLQLNGSGFGDSWYIPTAYNNPLRKIFISGEDKFGGPISIDIPADAIDSGHDIYSWQDDRILIYVPEDASSEIYVENFHAENPDSEIKEVSIICHEIQKIDDNGDKPIWYWGETCVLYGRNFGDRQEHSKLLIAGQEVLTITAWTNNQIIFVFAGLDLSMFPHGEFPFGDNVMVSVLKYGTEGDLRCDDRCSVECWKSLEDRHVSIASSESGIQSRGIGEDTTKGGLTIPPGGGGLMEQAIRLDGGDFAFTKAGRLEFVTRRPKLLEDLLIRILTYYGNDPYHPTYGCKHEFEIGGIYNQEWYQHNLKAELIRVLNDYINSQKQVMKLKQTYFVNQLRRTFIYDVELIRRVKDIVIDFHETEIRISLQLETLRGDLVLKTILGRKGA